MVALPVIKHLWNVLHHVIQSGWRVVVGSIVAHDVQRELPVSLWVWPTRVVSGKGREFFRVVSRIIIPYITIHQIFEVLSAPNEPPESLKKGVKPTCRATSAPTLAAQTNLASSGSGSASSFLAQALASKGPGSSELQNG